MPIDFDAQFTPEAIRAMDLLYTDDVAQMEHYRTMGYFHTSSTRSRRSGRGRGWDETRQAVLHAKDHGRPSGFGNRRCGDRNPRLRAGDDVSDSEHGFRYRPREQAEQHRVWVKELCEAGTRKERGNNFTFCVPVCYTIRQMWAAD